jgi:hypothetical protein
MSIITPLSEHEQNIVHVSTSSYVTPFEKLEALNEIQADENTDPDVKAVITNIFETNQAGLMLFLASDCFHMTNIQVPLTDDIDIIITVSTDTSDDAVPLKVDVNLKHKDSDTQFTLVFVDDYQEFIDDLENFDSDESDELKHVNTYLYGDPQSSDWSTRKHTFLDDIRRIVIDEKYS